MEIEMTAPSLASKNKKKHLYKEKFELCIMPLERLCVCCIRPERKLCTITATVGQPLIILS